VLAEALDERTPLLECAKFLAIFTSNLDEFFMKRIALLRSRATVERVKLLAEIRERGLQRTRPRTSTFSQELSSSVRYGHISPGGLAEGRQVSLRRNRPSTGSN
jgi:polyphosphate kinase